MKIEVSTIFERKFRKIKKKNPQMYEAVRKSLKKIVDNPFDPSFEAHKLKGKLRKLVSVKCGYDCRILFEIIEKDGEKVLFLFNFGTHDEIYR